MIPMEMVVFVVLAVVAVVSALGIILQKRILYCALALLVNLVTLAGLYVLLNAQFIAVVQIIVYAGAVVVLFIFGIMLLEVDWEDGRLGRVGWLRFPAAILAAALLVEVVYSMATGLSPSLAARQLGMGAGGVDALGRALYTDFLLPFELASVLILAGVVGAVFLARVRPSTPQQADVPAAVEEIADASAAARSRRKP